MMNTIYLFILLGLIATSFTVYAAATVQPYNSTYELQDADQGNFPRLTISDQGDVGIGNDNPLSKLHVDASAFPPATGDVLIGNGDTSSGQNTYVTIGRTAGTAGTGMIDSWQSGGGAHALALQTLFGGNVGIGTTTPAEKLDVAGNIRLTGNIVSPNDICIGTCP